ncbi:MAG: flagellar basal body rod C-terminal domain-containing protein [Candidatus Korobacteraceae bacterium]
MSSVETPLTNLLTHALDLTAQRQGLVTENIANIDTPGYHTRDIDFHSELERAMTMEHADPVGSTPFVREVPGLIERPDGNNVNIDQEASNLMLYQQAYQASAEVISTVNQMLQTIMNMGAASAT